MELQEVGWIELDWNDLAEGQGQPVGICECGSELPGSDYKFCSVLNVVCFLLGD
jgi:hypothetical protein